MSLKEEELKRAKETSIKFESELKEISLKNTMVNDERRQKLIPKLSPASVGIIAEFSTFRVAFLQPLKS